MNDNDYIKAAVELAEGFEWDIERDVIVDTQYGQLNMAHDEPLMLDALAAQLVRQVDALDTKFILMDGFGKAIIQDTTTMSDAVMRVEGPDRTLNTIKAIVDSGVLAATEQVESYE